MARLVRCPKCSKLILEYPEVPVYKCGGCNTVLRGSHSFTSKNAISAKEADGPAPLQADQTDSKSESLVSNVAEKSDEGLGSSGSIDERNENDTPDTIVAESKTARSIEGESNKQVDSSLKIEQLSNENPLNANEQSSHSKQGSLSSKEDSFDRVTPDGALDDVTRSPGATSAHYYDGSVSSDDGIISSNLGRPTSRRTLGHRTNNNSGNKENDMRGDIVRKGKTVADTEGEDGARTTLPQFSKESDLSDILRSFKIVRDEVYSKYPINKSERGTSFDLGDNQDKNDWFEQDKDTFHRSLSDGSTIKSALHDLEMLKKIDELKYRIAKLYGLNEYHKPARGLDEETEFGSSYSPHSAFQNRHQGSPFRRPEERVYPQPNHSHRRMTSAGSAYDAYSVSSDGGSSGKYNRDLERSKVNEKPRRHCRPLGNAAPFVVCYNCTELLQLPADFFISRRKPNRLKCGACNEVLSMSFVSKAVAQPETPEVGGPTDNNVESVDDSNKNEDSTGLLNSDNHLYSDKVMGRLHMLMGYDSARDILYRYEEENESGKISHPGLSSEKNTPSGSVRGSNAPSDSEERQSKGSSVKSVRSRRSGLPRP